MDHNRGNQNLGGDQHPKGGQNLTGYQNPAGYQGARGDQNARQDQNSRGNQNAGPPVQDMYIAIMGVTGSGKSTFIQTCAEKTVKIGHSLQSCTTDVEDVHFMYNPTLRVHLIDTPGFDDTNVSDAQVLQNIAHWLSMSFQNGIKLSGIIYLHRITDPRMTGSVRRNLLMFKKLCGEKSFSSVVLATTRWSMIDEATGIAHEEELKNTEAFWGHMYKKGSKVFRHTGSHAGLHTGSRDSALALIGYILNLHTRVTLDIQDEIVNHGQDISDTAASRELNADIIREQKKHQAELEAMRLSMEEAMAEHDEELRNSLKEEYDELQARVNKGAEEQAKLRQTLEEVHERKEKEFAAYKAEQEAERQRERQRSNEERRALEETFARQQQQLLEQMASASHEEKERRDAEIRAQMQEQQRAYDESLRQIKNENAARERKRQDEEERRRNSSWLRRVWNAMTD